MKTVSDMEILKIYGDPRVAEIAVCRFRNHFSHDVEVVDGLTPPLTRADKWIINISTQFGCPVGCPFCDASMTYAGNCSVEEMEAQIQWALDRHPDMEKTCRKLKVHLARMGEPSLNDHVPDLLESLRDRVPCPELWVCLATVAPIGRDDWFQSLLHIKNRLFHRRFQLQFSVQSTDPEHRRRLIPIPHWSLEEIARFGRVFHRPGDRSVVLNFALARDIAFDPEVLIRTFSPRQFAVKITPVNPTESGTRNGVETVLRSGWQHRLESAVTQLGNAGFDVILSVGDAREDLIGSNCGQAVRAMRNSRTAELMM